MKRQDLEVSMGTKTLRGSLWIPDALNDLGKYPAVVFSHGGGPQNRGGYNDTFEDKPSEMAQFFINNGYIVALWDKPGTGESTGDWRSEELTDCADNLVAVVEWIKNIERSNGTVGVWGLSQGGMVGPLAGGKSKGINFVISASSSWVARHEQEIFRIEHTLRRNRMNEQQIKEAVLATKDYHRLELNHAPWDDVISLCKLQREKDWYRTSFLWYVSGWGEEAYLANCNNPGNIGIDIGCLQLLTCPVLFQWGLNDDCVDARRNRHLVERAIPPNSASLFTLRSYDELGHSLNVLGESLCDCHNSNKTLCVVHHDILNWLNTVTCTPNKAFQWTPLRGATDL